MSERLAISAVRKWLLLQRQLPLRSGSRVRWCRKLPLLVLPLLVLPLLVVRRRLALGLGRSVAVLLLRWRRLRPLARLPPV